MWKSIFCIKTILFCFLLVLGNSIYAQKFKIKGSSKGVDVDLAVLYYRDANFERVIDTQVIKNSKFRFYGDIIRSDFVIIEFYRKTPNGLLSEVIGEQFFLEPGIVSIVLKNKGFSEIQVFGSFSHSQYLQFKKSIKSESEDLKKLMLEYTYLDSLQRNLKIDFSKAKKLMESINSLKDSLLNIRIKKEFTFINNHKKSYVSINLLHYLIGRIQDNTIDSLYKSISDVVKGSTIDLRFLTAYAKYRNAIAKEYPFDLLKVNTEAPPFYIYNSGSNESLVNHNFKNRILIIEFWGLYCIPCLHLIPELEAIRRKNAGQISIISIINPQIEDSLKLLSYLKKQRLENWIHVSFNPKFDQWHRIFYSGNFGNYDGLGVPRTVIINPTGQITYRHSGYSEKDLPRLKNLIDSLLFEINRNDKH